jgi:hypothetical protein
LLGIAVLFAFCFALAAQPAKPPEGKPPAAGDKTGGNKSGYEPFKDGPLGDDKDKPTTTELNTFRHLTMGNLAPNAQGAQQVMDKMARWLLYRLTRLDVQEGRESGGIPQVLEELFSFAPTGAFPRIGKGEADQDEMTKRQYKRQFVREFRIAATPHVRKLLQIKDLIVRVNAARLLHRFAEFGEEEVADDCIRIIDNPYEHDAVRHWAIKALGEVFKGPAGDATPSQPQAAAARGQRIENGALAIAKWLKARCEMPAPAVNELRDEEKNGLRFVRKEAVRTLTATHRPWAVEKEVAGQIRRDGPIAGVLFDIMMGEENKISPEPSWEERVEAAHGLCFLEIRAGSNYQPDFAVEGMGRFIAALSAAANDDKSRQKERWRYFASHLQGGGDNLRAMLERTPPTALRPEATTYMKKALDEVRSAFSNLNDPMQLPQAAQNLNNWLNQYRAPSRELYRTAAPASGG